MSLSLISLMPCAENSPPVTSLAQHAMHLEEVEMANNAFCNREECFDAGNNSRCVGEQENMITKVICPEGDKQP